MVEEGAIREAATAIRRGDLVVYPTETVYGLGVDALDPEAVERVFDAKDRDRDQPVSMALPSVDAIADYVAPSDRELAFCRHFLPGPVTVVLAASDVVPSALTGGRDRVGVRVPDHEAALALTAQAGPITATSANVSGRPSARRVDHLDQEIVDAVAVVLDGGETPGGGSTVVDVAAGEVLRRGPNADAVDAWLAQ